MAADSYDITIDQGADWFWTVRWLVGKSRKTAVPKDITGHSTELVIADDYNAADYVLTLSTDNGGAAILVDKGAFQFHATAAETTDLPIGKLLYEIRATSPDNVVRRMVCGVLTVKPKV